MQEVTVTTAQIAQTMSYMTYGVGVSGLIQLIILLLFIGSIRKTMRPVPAAQRSAPIWLLWFLLLPVVGALFFLIGLGIGFMMVSPIIALIIAWIMIPFVVPQALSRHYADRSDLIKRAHNLKLVGLWCVILSTVVTVIFVASPSSMFARFNELQAGQLVAMASGGLLLKGIKAVCGLGYGVLAIIYWCQIVSFRRAAHHTQHEG